ncbi:MAG: cupin domain-containing protein [Blastocatellia bacterium]|nr:cupin domain-containing protein [Blastocatellia bacterium]
MPVINNTTIPKFNLPGLEHQTLAAQGSGVNGMEVWMQTIAPGAGTPVHRHACEEVIVIFRGSGQATINGEAASVGPNSTIIVPPDAVHQLINTGPDEMFLVGVLGTTPVRVTTAEGETIPLPWQG